MKNGPLFFIGLFAALTISWAGVVLASHLQLGSLTPYYDEGESQAFPQRVAGIAARGQYVYADLGCAACHTQQVRRPDYGADQVRGWGDRQSVARDYIFQARPQLGTLRIGPDLTNLAGRKPTAPDAEDLLQLLYAGSPTHPPYKFLFDTRKIVGETSADALKLRGNLAVADGYEVVPTERALTLAAYLLSLNNAFDYPEARPMPHPAEKAEAAKGDAKKAEPQKAEVKKAEVKKDEAKKDEAKKDDAKAAPAAAPAQKGESKAEPTKEKRDEKPVMTAPPDDKKKVEGKK